MANDLKVRYSPGLADTPIGRHFRAFDATNKRGVFKRVAERLWNLVRAHFREIEPTHHKTANSFSPAATPTGYWERAQRGTTLQYSAQSGTVTIDTPGISRAFHPLDIKAKKKMLTIPARPSPEAYGRTASQVAAIEPLFLVSTKTHGAFLATGTEPMDPKRPKGRKPPRPQRVRPHKPNKAILDAKEEHGIRPVFWLRAAVRIPKERGILPSNKQITDAATEEFAIGVRDFVLGRK